MAVSVADKKNLASVLSNQEKKATASFTAAVGAGR